jgi:glycosyltransferase involved in cell wall biosynthesis
MNEYDPLISIAMPVRNNSATLDLAVRSMQWQTYENWELILIDDGSTDDTAQRARRCAAADSRIRVLVDGHGRGLPERLNQAIGLSRGPFFARMDGDDVAYPERLERQLEYLQAHPTVDLVGASAIVFADDGRALGKRACGETHEEICARPSAGFALVHPTFFGRIEFFRKYQYRASAVRCEDQDLLLRSYTRPRSMLASGMLKSQDQDLLVRSFKAARFANVPEVLIGYRESRLDWKKNLTSRKYVAISFFQNHWKDGHRALALRALFGQVFKSLVDLLAIGTGLDYQILRHRARPISADERGRWTEVWTTLNDGLARSREGAHPMARETCATGDDRCLAC